MASLELSRESVTVLESFSMITGNSARGARTSISLSGIFP